VGQSCRGHEQCEAGQACVNQKCTLMDHVSCETNLNCPEYEQCINGTCVMCASDADCREGFVCNYAGLCLPKDGALLQCTQSSDCSAGEVCYMGDCTPFGSDVMECQTKLHPIANAMCAKQSNVIPGLCLDTKNCNSDTDCHSGYRCYMNNCERVYCQDNSDCSSTEICINGGCYEKCSESYNCLGGSCRDGICELNGECSSDADCSEGTHCYIKEDVDYPYRERESSKRQMGVRIAPSQVFYQSIKESSCVECIDDSHCSGNNHCINHTCKPYECSADSDCGEGKFCKSTHVCATLARMCSSEDSPNNNSDSVEINIDFQLEGTALGANVNESEGSSNNVVECSQNEVCDHGYCYSKMSWPPSCVEDTDCRSMRNGLCNPVKLFTGSVGFKAQYQVSCAIGCTSDAECPSGIMGINNICRNGVCTSGMTHEYCTSDVDCTDGHKCNTLYGECVGSDASVNANNNNVFASAIGGSTVACWRDATCNGLSCLASGQCGCTKDSQCGAGSVCNAEGSCVCKTDAGCGAGYRCFDAMCLCKTDDACGDGKLCKNDGKCVDNTDVSALLEHAAKYENGKGVEQDIVKAISYYEQAVSAGSMAAAIRLGRIYVNGKGVKKDKSKGEAFIKTAVKLNDQIQSRNKKVTEFVKSGNAAADKLLVGLWNNRPKHYIVSDGFAYSSAEDAVALGELYLEGKYVKKDVDKGEQLFSDSLESVTTLANMYYTGDVIPQDLVKARKLYGYANRQTPSENDIEARNARKYSAKTLIYMALNHIGDFEPVEYDESESVNNNERYYDNSNFDEVSLICNAYEYLGNMEKDAAAAYEYVSMCAEGYCHFCENEDELLKMAVDADIEGASCRMDNEGDCRESFWRQMENGNYEGGDSDNTRESDDHYSVVVRADIEDEEDIIAEIEAQKARDLAEAARLASATSAPSGKPTASIVKAALEKANNEAQKCYKGSEDLLLQLSIEPSGSFVVTQVLGGGIAGTPSEKCIISVFNKASVDPFNGNRIQPVKWKFSSK